MNILHKNYAVSAKNIILNQISLATPITDTKKKKMLDTKTVDTSNLMQNIVFLKYFLKKWTICKL